MSGEASPQCSCCAVEHSETKADTIVGVITRNFWFSSGLVLLLILLIFTLLYNEAKLRGDGFAIINQSGRQRMLLQSIHLSAHKLRDVSEGEDDSEIRRKIRDDVMAMATVHGYLRRHHATASRKSEIAQALEAIYFNDIDSLDRKMNEFIALASNVALPRGDFEQNEKRFEALDAFDSEALLAMLEKVVSLYQKEANDISRRIHLLEYLSLSLILLVLVLLSIFIFRPMVHEVRLKTAKILESEKRLSVITDTIGEGILVADRSLCITFVNAEGENLLKYEPGSLIGMKLASLTAGNDGVVDDLFLRPLEQTIAHRTERERFIDRDGRAFPVSLSVSPIVADERSSGLVVAFHDITEQHANEARLRKAKDEAVQANRSKDQFMSLIAHDLRSPMTSLFQLLSYLESEAISLSERHRHSLQLGIDAASQMMLMIEESLIPIECKPQSLIQIESRPIFGKWSCGRIWLPNLKPERKILWLKILSIKN